MERLSFKAGEALSHAYIIAAPSRDEREGLSRALAAAYLCSGEGERPCGSCRDCRKAAAGVHPDLITLRRGTDDKGRQKRELLVDQIRFLVSDAQVMPNEAARKVYIVEDADTMNTQAQNAFLKLLEEPPPSAAFILCAANPAMLLPTVRSRCAVIKRNSDGAPDAEAHKLARQYLKLAAGGEEKELLRWCFDNAGMDARAAEAFVSAARALCAEAVAGRASIDISAGDALALEALLTKCAAYMKLNTGVRHIFGLLAVDAPIAKEMRKSN